MPKDVLHVEPPKGAVSLALAIGALRDELTQAWSTSRDAKVRFKPAPVELTLQVAVTSEGTGRAGVRWWLLELGGELAHESAVTQTVKVNLEPVLFDDGGNRVEFLVDTSDDSTSQGDSLAEELLDTAE
jgi:hypothetical protein